MEKRVKNTFTKIKEAKSIECLTNIEESFDNKFRIDQDKFPQLALSITREDIQSLIKNKIIDKDDFSFIKHEDIMLKLTTPLEKLFYAMAWKQNNLSKLKHIIKGFDDAIEGNSFDETRNSFVFYQFGRHLTNKKEEPIIDQHILRAFISKNKLDSNQTIWNVVELLSKKKKEIYWIKEYKEWLVSKDLGKISNNKYYVYHIDKILFALGKSIKKTN